MIRRGLIYLRRHHLAIVALFIALGGTGAYAAIPSAGGQVRGFGATPTSGSSGTLATADGVTLRWRMDNKPDERVCSLVLRASRSGALAVFSGTQTTGSSKTAPSTTSQQLAARRTGEVALARFLPGAPGIVQHVEGELTYGDDAHAHEVTAVFHVGAAKNRCLFEGTLTGAS